MRILLGSIRGFLVALGSTLYFVDNAFASTGVLDWKNFSFRVINLVIVLGIVYIAFGKKIRTFFATRREKMIQDFELVEKMKQEAIMMLEDVEKKMEKLETERMDIIAKSEEEAHAVREQILAQANSQAELILSLAHKTAEAETIKTKQKLLTELADRIYDEVEKKLSTDITQEMQKSILKKSIEKVVSCEKELNCKTLC